MPTYIQLMDCAPQEYQAAGRAVDAFAARVATAKQGVREQFEQATAPGTWSGRARDAADRSGQTLNRSLDQLDDQLRQAGRVLQQAGQEISAAQTQLRTLSTQIRAQGWIIAPIGVVWLGQPQIDMVTAAGPGAPAMYATLQGMAIAMTTEIFSIVATASVADVAAAEALLQVSVALGGAGILAITPHLREHIFDGHRRAHRISGYHFRPGGVDSGANGFTVDPSSMTPVDANGVYRGRVSGLDLNNHVRRKPSTFFPDHWTEDDINQAVRGAFYNRQPVYWYNTSTNQWEWHASKWRGQYNGMTFEGFVDGPWATAGPGSISSAYPIL